MTSPKECVELESKLVERGLNAPRVTPQSIEAKIKNVEYHLVQTSSGRKFMYCYITLENGFEVTGKPSVCVSGKNFCEETGREISYKNAFSECFGFEAYLLAEKIHKGEV
ncbi:Gp49 family protein [Shewanella glacialipiscicola]|uniref:Gp49 family protein n=1 Tax=Shewanella glacialipiscicola TaxID=614069 RepID=UPI003D796596